MSMHMDDMVRIGYQCLYGSWAGTMIVQGRSDADIEAHLRSSLPATEGLVPTLTATAERALANVVRGLHTLRDEMKKAGLTK